MQVISWITSNWGSIVAVVSGLVTVASVVTALTPTPKDDAALAWIRKILDFLSVLKPKTASGTLKVPLTSTAEEKEVPFTEL